MLNTGKFNAQMFNSGVLGLPATPYPLCISTVYATEYWIDISYNTEYGIETSFGGC